MKNRTKKMKWDVWGMLWENCKKNKKIVRTTNLERVVVMNRP